MSGSEIPKNYIWPGLASYQEGDKNLFFGREAEIFDLSRKILNSKLTILSGPSGAGKTSLLQAGVFPKLRQQNLLPIPIRIEFPSREDPFTPISEQLRIALIRESQTERLRIIFSNDLWFTKRIEMLTLWEWLRSFYIEGDDGTAWRPVFIFDQFEEIFTLGKNANGLESILQQLGDAAENFLPEEINHLINCQNGDLPFNTEDQPYKMVISLREDYFAQLQSLRQILPGVTVRQNLFSLIRLTGNQALQAIIGPAPIGMISSQVAKEIICFVANSSEQVDSDKFFSDQSLDHFDVEPAILSLVCQQLDLKRNSQGEKTITVDFVKQSKGQIIEEFYESSMQLVQNKTRYYIENKLLDFDGYRTSEPESNLIQDLIDQNDIQHLVNLRLIHKVEHYRRSHLELSHDVLAPVVKTSRDNRAQREETIKQQTEIAQLKKQRYKSMTLTICFAVITVFALISFFFGVHKQTEALIEKNRTLMEKKKAVSLFYFNKAFEISQINVDQALCYAQLAYQIDSASPSANMLQKFLFDNTNQRSTVIFKNDSAILQCFDKNQILTISKRGRATLWDLEGNRISNYIGENDSVVVATFNKDFVFTAYNDSSAKVWDLTGNPILDLKGELGVISNAWFSPAGDKILTLYCDAKARLWDLKGNLITDFREHDGPIYTLIFSPNGQQIVTAGENRTAKLWDLKGNQLAEFKGHHGPVDLVVFSPKGQHILTVSDDNIPILWDLKGNRISNFKGHKYWLNSIVFSPDGQQILSASDDHTAKLWDLKGILLTDFVGHKGEVNLATFSPDGQQILTASDDFTVRSWDLHGKLILDLRGHQGAISSIEFSQNGKQILTSSFDGTAILWDNQGRIITQLKGHQERLSWAKFFPNGQQILTLCNEGTAKVWNLNGNLESDINGLQNWKNAVTLSPDGQCLLTITPSAARILNLEGILAAEFRQHTGWIYYAIFSPDGQRILTVSDKNTIFLSDRMGNLISEYKGNGNWISTVAFSPDGQRIVIASQNQAPKLFDLKGDILSELKGSQGWVYSAIFSPNGQYILTVSDDNTPKLWDLNGNLMAEFRNHKFPVNTAIFSPDGNRILTASDDKTAKLWDLKGNLILDLKGHHRAVNSAIFSPDGQHILSASDDFTAKVWDLGGNTIADLKGHQREVVTAVFSPDGERILTASQDKTAKIWNREGKILNDLKGHLVGLNSAQFFPDGKRIMTHSSDGNLKIWTGFVETLTKLSQNSHKEKLSITEIAKIPIELSKFEFDTAVANNIINGDYLDYKKLFDENNNKK